MRNEAYVRAALLAEKTLLRFHADTLPVDPENMLRQIPGVRLLSLEEGREKLPAEALRAIEDGAADAIKLQRGESTVIVYREDIPVERLRFNFAHELGHIALRHVSGLQDPRQESAANCYALHLLMPPPLMRALSGQWVWAEQAAVLCYLPWRWAQLRQNYSCELDEKTDRAVEEMLAPFLKGMILPPMEGRLLHRMPTG